MELYQLPISNRLLQTRALVASGLGVAIPGYRQIPNPHSQSSRRFKKPPPKTLISRHRALRKLATLRIGRMHSGK